MKSSTLKRIETIINSNNFTENDIYKLYQFNITSFTEKSLEQTLQQVKTTFEELDNLKNNKVMDTTKYIHINLLHINFITEILGKIADNQISFNNSILLQEFVKLLKERQEYLKLLKERQDTLESMIDNLANNKQKTKLIKSSLHYQLLKQGKDPIKQQSIFDEMSQQLSDEITKVTVQKIGLDLGANHTQAIHAIQKMLNITNYAGNADPITNAIGQHSPYFGVVDYLPSIRFTPSEYLDAYGLKKNKNNTYNRTERDLALKALKDLNNLPFAMYYQRINPQNKNKVDLIKQIKPLISITEGYKAIDPETANQIVLGNDETKRITHIAIAPHPILIDQIDSYFVWKPADCYTEIKLLAGSTNKYTFNFVDYLITEYGQRNRKKDGITNTEIRINYLNLAYKLQMESLINSRQWKRIKTVLLSCYTIAKQAGYLSNFQTMQEGKNDTIEILHLNPEKFGKEAIIKREKELQKELQNE